jgi:hypothetical protein
MLLLVGPDNVLLCTLLAVCRLLFLDQESALTSIPIRSFEWTQ